MVTLSERVIELAKAIGGQFKQIRQNIGSVADLQTADKSSLVAAINEARTSGGSSGAAIDDTAAAADKAYSSQKTAELISAAKTDLKNELTNGADAAYDTFKEVAEYIAADKTGAAAMAEQIGKRLRVDEAQQLTTTQKAAVEQTLNLGDTATDFVAAFNQALK